MKYKNIIFDFGNVIAQYDEEYIMHQFCKCGSDMPYLLDVTGSVWTDLDEGSLDYDETASRIIKNAPERHQALLADFFENWYKHMPPILEIWRLVRDLKKAGYGVYLLSNADIKFARECEYYEILKQFDGRIFSAEVKCNKPKTLIYHSLFHTFHLDPKDCFFIDDREENIDAGRNLGMDGIVFKGDVSAVREAIDFPKIKS